MKFKETQLTRKPHGHTIHYTSVFSKDDNWIVYDTRNNDTMIVSTGSIEMVNVKTGEVKVLYNTENQTEYGPGVGAATFSPTQNEVLFIHGIRNANELQPYGVTRRTGVAIDINRPQKPIFMDARDITFPFTKGALRGGTHAHSWSGDGQWISFTYNDYVMEKIAKVDSSIQDLRTVGIMVPGKVIVGDDGSLENNDGKMFSVVVSKVTEHPNPKRNEIDKAFDESWIGSNGYIKLNGKKQEKAIAFQGNVRDIQGNAITEVFVLDLPKNITKSQTDLPLEGTVNTRPNVPESVIQRRVTYTKNGIEGPRHWLRSKADGSLIAFLAKDSLGIIQVFGVSPNGGAIQQLTHNEFSVQGPFNFSPDGNWIAYPADNSIFINDLKTGKAERITKRFSDNEKPIGAPVWSNDSNKIAYNRYVKDESGDFLQIFLLDKAP